MRNRLLFLLLCLTFTTVSRSQLVGTDCFLQGRWLEIGVDRMGAFGTCTSPSTYHVHNCYCTNLCTQGAPLDASYDWGHDGWATGSPCFMGNYTIPGFPQEGWSIQVGATEYRNWASGGTCTGPFAVPGSLTAYSNIGGNKTGTFVGTIAGLRIVQETRVDTLASWVVVTARIYNTTAAPIAGVYYERTCDPDNTSHWAGSSVTTNVIVHQNEDARHMVQIGTYYRGNSYSLPTISYDRWNSYLSLATRDCRAKCGTITGLSPSNTPAQLWAGTGSVVKVLNDSNTNDVGIFLVYNIGTIPANDSAVVSYAYIYNGNHGIDSAFPDPVLRANGATYATINDTLNLCTLPPGVDTVALDILYGEDKCWTWGKWTWTPGTGLSATTGAHIVASGGFLSGPVTYTVTGTDSAMGMYSCNTRKLYITIKPCHFAYSNGPCIGDTLKLDMYGDSVGATYFWYGPGGFRAFVRNPWKYPTTWADTGTYYVVKTHSGIHDTDFVHVVIHPLPVVNATSNIPKPCDPFVNPFNLFVNLDSAGETFSWTGPKGFTSTLQNPSITPFDSTMEGTYTVTGTTIWGCKASNSTTVWPGVVPDFGYVIHYGCVWDTVELINWTYNANYYEWKFEDGTPDVKLRNTSHIFRAPNKKVNIYMRATNAHCDTTISKVIDLTHSIKAEFDPTPDTLCFNNGVNTVNFNSSSAAIDSNFTGLPVAGYRWQFADGSTDNSSLTPTHTFTAPGIYPVQLVVSDAMGCEDSVIHKVFVVDIQVKSFHDTLLCVSQPLALKNEIVTIPAGEWPYKYSWSQSPVVNLDNDTVQIPHLFGVGLFTDILTVTIPGVVPDGCPVTNTMVINSVLGKKLQKLTVSQTIDYGSSIQLNASNEVIYYWMPNDGSLDNNNINNPIATPKRTTTYTVYGLDDNGCKDSAYITVFVDTTMEQDVPTAFSPNGDGVNDVFRPVGLKFQNLVEFRVYNRWGQEIFYSNNREVGWDGTYHGTKQDLGVYNYMIIVARPGQDNIAYKGNVTLIR